MSQLAGNTSHINNGFRYHNVVLMMGMTGVQYSWSYEANCFVTSSTHAAPADSNVSVSFSVAHTAMHYSSEHHNDA